MQAAAHHGPWPPRPVAWGDAHLPPEVRGALRLGTLRRELFGLTTGSRLTDAGSNVTIRVPVGDNAHFEWVQTQSDTRTGGAFLVRLAVERRAGDKKSVEPLDSYPVAWESISGSGGEPYWPGPVFVPAGGAILLDVSASSATPFRATLVGARLVR